MKKIFIIFLLACSFITHAQEKIISLYPAAAPGSETWNWPEQVSDSNVIRTKLVYNISKPTLTVFAPDKSIANGTAVIICPGGGFQFLSIESEGFEVARWLNAKGITAFVLKYRVAHTMADPVKEFMEHMGNQKKFEEEVAPIIKMAVSDASQAMLYVRQHAADWNINPKKIGLMGFSAGGTLTSAIAFTYTRESRPDFIAPIYPFVGGFPKSPVPADAPPMFTAAASDDYLVPVQSNCVSMYDDWITAKHIAEIHIYSKGGHGFGMRKQNLPSDHWIERFGEWLEVQGLLKK
ncbi:MAG: alpha/beta hydrolase [Bacteroidetes bacterium]|nr:alpha/beta hydrolase [Bacteroidota bacterium]